jgi:rhodanese-related sulfurtransferase
MEKDAPIYLVCAAGGQAALAGKTLIDMGYTNVTNIGGIGDWTKAGGPVEGA